MIKFLNILPILFAIVAGASLCSCEDEFDSRKFQNDKEGENTVISLKIIAPEMAKVVSSRSNMADKDAYNVQTLWVGIYNKNTGNSTLETNTSQKGLFLKAGEPGFTSPTGFHDPIQLTNIKTKSGLSYIVAVANPDQNYGYKIGENGALGEKTKLLELLQAASKWEDFRSIIIERDLFQNCANLEMPFTGTPLPMSGIFISGKDGAAITDIDWNTNVEPTPIPISSSSQSVTLQGAIHLRRPFSQIKVNIQKANEAIVDIEPMSYTIHNVPTYGWLYERPQVGEAPTNLIDYANAGDAMQTDVKKNDNYKPSLTYTTTDFSVTQAKGSDPEIYSFDFWMMENKRTGLETCTAYAHREREYIADGKNTGVYSSLCPGSNDSYTETLNNMATYIEIKCRLTYDKDHKFTADEVPTGVSTDNIKSRMVDATYIVHLGYVGDDPLDFNSYRNSIYTYSINVKSATNIVVEASTEDEPQPGAEGMVADATDILYELDAHYNAFNIYLSQGELDNFNFTMRSTYDNAEYFYGTDKDGKELASARPIPNEGDSEYKFYSWVELMPTTGENVLAPYPGTDKTYKLGDMRANPKLTEGWFTVFVNEYTYEDSSDESKSGNWRKYVNQPNRFAFINVGTYVSNDGNSSYFLSKYGISQKSIQTYYETTGSGFGTALGVEHDNETFGMVIRWPTEAVATTTEGVLYPSVPGDDLSHDNGRINVWTNVGGSLGNDKAGNWTTYVQCGNANPESYTDGKINTVNAIDNENQTIFMSASDKESKTYPVPQPMLLSPSAFTTNPPDNYLNERNSWKKIANIVKVNEFDPQTKAANAQIIHAMHACMNRNRDNNGNGIIDADELRWYLPTSGKYIRVIMGRNSLSSPILNYAENVTLPYHAKMGWNSRLHLASSDARMIWTDEGISSSEFLGENYGPAPWEVRCIRNLGVDLSSTVSGKDEDPVEPAYKFTNGTGEYESGGICKIIHYYGSAVRAARTAPIPLHKVPDNYNKLGQYGFEVALRGNAYTTGKYAATNDETSLALEQTGIQGYVNFVEKPKYCSYLEDYTKRKGWRIPNQKELVIMVRAGILKFADSEDYFASCTQEFWTTSLSDDDKSEAVSTSINLDDYRFCTVRNDGNGTAVGRLELKKVRCVRDLTAAEANMTYNQILEYKQP